MNHGLSRRTVLAGAAAATVVAFDPAGLGWLTAADATPSTAVDVPDFDGELVRDDAARAEMADDYGFLVHELPCAVLRPGSVRDVVTMVRYANKHHLQVAMRGQGHSSYGQAQVAGGVVIDSRTQAAIHRIDPDRVTLDTGVRWLDLVTATLQHGLTPPVFPDYIGMSVGGTLCVGGIGGASSHHGLQVDNVLELEVVTGAGELVRCSATEHADLFRAVLGGFGQFGIIVRATLPLVPAHTTARVFRLSYPDLATYLADQRIAMADGRFSYLEGQAVPRDGGGWSYLLEGVAYYTPPDAPDDTALLAGLRHTAADVTEVSYVDWLNRIYDIVEQIKAQRLPSPGMDLFVPDDVIEQFTAETLAELTPADTGGGVVLLYPVPRRLLTRPFVMVPDGDVFFLFSILRVVAPPDDEVARAMVADNRAIYERARELGATNYSVGAVPKSPADWRRHFGDRYPEFVAAKARFDPRRVLTPGQGIFG
jgi:cytokinin dehydrogenase